MENENQISQLIDDDECDEGLETEEIQEVEVGRHLNVIPFRLIKLGGDVDMDSELVENEGNSSENNVEIASNSYSQNQFHTAVKGKYSKYYRQTYRPAWELMPDFKGWLKGVKGEPTRAYCTYCSKTLHAHRLSLLKHTCTIRHQKAAQIHGNPVQHHMNKFSVDMDSNNVQTVIVNEENLITGDDNSEELMQPQLVYTSQSETDAAEPDMTNELEMDEFEEGEDFSSESKEQQSIMAENNQNPIPISTNVIDTTKGSPVPGLTVSLYKLVEGRWTYINEGLTDNKGRCSSFFKEPTFSSGRYKLHYDVDKYFLARKQHSVFPFIEIVFDSEGLTRHHFPLLLSPNNYTIYRSTCDQ
ncbi:hypothetical protein HUJ04_003370 [Dendroctonus ponderosae]